MLDEVRSSIDDLSSFVEKHTSGNFVSINGGLELGKLRKCYDEVKKISNSTYDSWPFYCDQNLNSAMSGKLLKARTQSGTSITRTAAPDESAMHLSEPGDLTSIAMNAMAALARVPDDTIAVDTRGCREMTKSAEPEDQMGANTNKRSTHKRNAVTPAFSESRKRLVRRSGLCQANVQDELHERSAALEQSPCETAGPLAVTTPNNSTNELSTVDTTSEKDTKDEGHSDNECEGGCDERSAATNIAYQHVSGPLQQDALQQDVRMAESTLDSRTISDNSYSIVMDREATTDASKKGSDDASLKLLLIVPLGAQGPKEVPLERDHFNDRSMREVETYVECKRRKMGYDSFEDFKANVQGTDLDMMTDYLKFCDLNKVFVSFPDFRKMVNDIGIFSADRTDGMTGKPGEILESDGMGEPPPECHPYGPLKFIVRISVDNDVEEVPLDDGDSKDVEFYTGYQHVHLYYSGKEKTAS
ncbi:hypothetical protein AA0119_g13401 [Alternaria tenuissima]|uniref:Uncharacterized protein n=1 Tax=Alternaria tenuissima TaxID=119927 RepID=A0ABY0FNR5_9PLEO|nr:hypothetical protein AA0119_g13401 [Alternaria tenuissima]RYO00279.1 hypothetical protein AA0121_g13407 [Alternaria tenuissima]